MIGFRLQLKRRSDGRLMLTIPIGYKLLLLLIGVLILVSLITTRAEAQGSIFVPENTIPLILCLVSLLGAAYHERWIFDREKGLVVHENGLILLHKDKSYRFEELDRVELSQFIKGAGGATQPLRRSLAFRPIVTLALRTKDGVALRLENYRMSQLRKVEAIARRIAECSGVSYKNEISGGGEP